MTVHELINQLVMLDSQLQVYFYDKDCNDLALPVTSASHSIGSIDGDTSDTHVDFVILLGEDE